MAKLTEQEVRGLLAKFIGKNAPTMLAKVTEVNKSDSTCTLTDDGAEYPEVRLQAVVGESKGIVCYPAIGALALAVKIEDTDEWMLLSATKYDSIEISIESLVINGGKLGGLVKIEELINWMNKVKIDLTAISTSLNSLGYPVTITTPLPNKYGLEDTNFKH